MGLLILIRRFIDLFSIVMGVIVLAIISTLIVIPMIPIYLVLGPKYIDKYMCWSIDYIYEPSLESVEDILRRLNIEELDNE